MFDINGGEFVLLALLAALLLGPDRLPDLARQAARLIRRGRDFATGASAQMKDEMGVDLDGVDWRRYDPRQYHPKRIVQNALSDAFDDEGPARPRTSGAGGIAGAGASKAGAAAQKRAEAARTLPATSAAPRGTVTARTSGPGRDGAGRTGGGREGVRGTGAVAPLRPSPPPTSWAEAARRAGVDDDAT